MDYEAAIRGACRNALAEILDVVQAEAERLSSGTATPAQLRQDDHPYAQRHGHVQPPYDPVIINEQTSAFRTSWEQEPARETPDGFAGSVFNKDPKAGWLEFGTDRMLGRPLPLQTAINSEEQAASILQRHLLAALE